MCQNVGCHTAGQGLSFYGPVADADVEDNLESDASRNRVHTQDTPEDSNNERFRASPTANTCDNAFCSSVNGATSLDALMPVEHERTSSISSTTDSTVTITEENVDERSQSTETVGQLTQQVAALGIDNGSNSPSAPSSPQPEGGVPDGPGTLPKPSKAEMRQAMKIHAMQSLGEKYHPRSRECSVQSCLAQFTMPELLTGNNKFGCANCTRKLYVKNGKQGESQLEQLGWCSTLYMPAT